MAKQKINKALRESEKKFRAVIDHTFEFIGVLSFDGILTDANETALASAGMKKADVIGKPFWKTAWWAHSPELQERLKAAIRTAAAGKFVRFEATHPTSDGRLLTIDFSLKPVKDEAGRVLMLIPEGRDVTEERQLEQQVRLLARMTSMSPDAMAAFDIDERIVFWNAAAERLFGYRAAEAFGRLATDLLLPPDKVSEIRCPDSSTPWDAQAAVTDLRTERLHKDGTRIPVGFTHFPLFDEVGRRYGRAAIFHDLRAIIEMENRLVAQSKLATLGQMAASLAHEIRNPLFGISSVVQVVAREVEDRPLLQEMAQSMQREVERLKKLLGRLLLFARPSQIQKETAKPHVLGEAVRKLSQPILDEKGVRVEEEFAPAEAEIPLDSELMHQVLLNLYLNAIEASPEGGVVRIRSLVKTDPARWTFEISNGGPAIRSEDAARVFNPFFTTKSEGTGLGLAICKKIVEDHGGEIDFKSVPERGTTFFFTIPVK